ncbi:beta family protein [Bacillus sp. RG28]|uniref:Beta family protein n=1 Tax=Gottfriedia endophytica TaxID=2820819 RepID=A0A940SL90_9BACI|nr:beta family protein [Gottfriedia endophytica]MBP0726859.1 beta family protein [Gottfriedia endophytica]
MFDHNHYVPILKWKRGERTALEHLNQTYKDNMTPLIEIQPVPFDHENGDFRKSIDDHLKDVGTQVKTVWNHAKPIFVDLETLYDNEDFEDDILQSGQHPVEYVIDEIESNGVPAIPVTGLIRSQPFHTAIKSICSKYNRGICLRLEIADLSDIFNLKKNIDNLSNFLHLDKSMVDVILDYKQIIPEQEKQQLSNVTLTLVQLPYLMEWRTITLASTAFPKNLNKIPTGTSGTLPRSEWIIYQSLRNYGLARIPTFGDYTITHPDFVNIDPRLINVAAGIKYTSGNNFHIFRGTGTRNKGFGQMIQICINVINHVSYCGNTFSYGDQNIWNCAHQTTTTGTIEKWVTAGVNHHLTLVSHDLSNLHGASIVGSL